MMARLRSYPTKRFFEGACRFSTLMCGLADLRAAAHVHVQHM